MYVAPKFQLWSRSAYPASKLRNRVPSVVCCPVFPLLGKNGEDITLSVDNYIDTADPELRVFFSASYIDTVASKIYLFMGSIREMSVLI